MSCNLQSKLRSLLGIPVGIVTSHEDDLCVQCNSLDERDRIFSSLAQLCKVGLSMGFVYLSVQVTGITSDYRYGLAALLAFDKQFS